MPPLSQVQDICAGNPGIGTKIPKHFREHSQTAQIGQKRNSARQNMRQRRLIVHPQ